MFEGLRKPLELIMIVVTLLSMAVRSRPLCMPTGWTSELWPIGGIVRAVTVSRIQQSLVESGQLDLVQGPRR
jgi:hypothetical protein